MADETPKKKHKGRRPPRDFYPAILQAFQDEAAAGNLYPNCIKAVAVRAGVSMPTVVRAAEKGYPPIHGIEPKGGPFPAILDVMGQHNPVNPQALQPIAFQEVPASIDQAKDTLRDTFRNGFVTGSRFDLATVVLRAAANDKHPNQAQAWKIAAAYAFGTPTKSLDDSTVKRLAQELAAEMLTEMIAEAKKRRTIDVSNTPTPAVE